MSDPDLIRALSDLTLAVRGGLQMTTRSGDRSSDFFRPFASLTTITGTTGSTQLKCRPVRSSKRRRPMPVTISSTTDGSRRRRFARRHS